jgi:hypothetical protein
MSNLFLQQAKAHDFSYCGEPGFCAKCMFRFVRDFVTPIDESHGESTSGYEKAWPQEIFSRRSTQEHLAKELFELPISEFVKLQYWEGHLRMAFHAVRDPDLQASVLQRWLESPLKDVRFVDVVVFYLIRHGHLHAPVGDAWVKAAVALAEHTKDRSLVESLIWSLGRSIANYPTFASLARELGQQSPSIAKALNETTA